MTNKQTAADRLENARKAIENKPYREGTKPEEFVFDLLSGKYINLLTGADYLALSFDRAVSEQYWIVTTNKKGEEKFHPPSKTYGSSSDRPEEQCVGKTWWPGKPRLIPGWVSTEDRMVETFRADDRTYNMYQPPNKSKMLAAQGENLWEAHVRKMFPEDEPREFLLDLFAHMVQRPGEKSNAVTILSGEQGIGKDTILGPVRVAVGQHNATSISPESLVENYTDWIENVMVVVDEARMGRNDHSARAFYDRLKEYNDVANGNDRKRVNGKYQRTRTSLNVARFFITTNEPDSIRIPEGDRRILLMHSTLPMEWWRKEDPEWPVRFSEWIENGGNERVIKDLEERDISKFKPKGAVPRTDKRKAVAATWSSDALLEDAIDRVRWPEVLFAGHELLGGMDDDEALTNLISRKAVQMVNRMANLGYTKVLNPDSRDGRWMFKFEGRTIKSRAVYYRTELLGNISGPDLVEKVRQKARTLGAEPSMPSAGS